MMLYSPEPPQRQVAIPEGSALLIAYQEAQGRILVLEEENAALRQEIRWIDKLLAVPASVMSPSQKVTLRAAAKAIQKTAPDEKGLVQIESWKLCKTVGQSKDTFLDNLTYLSDKVGALHKQTQRIVTEDGNYTTNLYIGATDLIACPESYHVEKPRNHGGERLLCPHCHSDRLQKKVTITCMGCGAVLDERATSLNKEKPDQPGIPGTTMFQHGQVATSNRTSFFDQAQSNLTTDITKDQEGQVDDAREEGTPSGEFLEQEPTTPPMGSAGETPSDPAGLMHNAAALLVEIAGTEPVQIEMSARGPKKYYDVARVFSLEDACAHLTGKKTKGAMLRRADGLTRALCYDADTDDDWYTLREAAHFLASAGYIPLMEESPAGRGGHLWIVYTDLVDARCAHRHVRELAPMLQDIKECWPGSGNHKVRLPGGLYVKPGFSQQCKLYDAIGGLVAENRQEAARALLTLQTPASIVPAYPPDSALDPDQRCAAHQLPKEKTSRSDQSDQTTQPSHGPDARWQQKYNAHLWFQFTPAQLAAWYNERHAIEELLPPERNGMGLAGWRGERTASIGYTRDGEGWVDFGASARRNDGKQDGGDALELEARISDQGKPETMRLAARDLVKEARAALESAARSGLQPPAWVQELLTPAGKAHYQDLLLLSESIPTQEALAAAGNLYQVALPLDVAPLPGIASALATGGVAGSCSADEPMGAFDGPYPPPARASYCCRSTSWVWNERTRKYVCGSCQK